MIYRNILLVIIMEMILIYAAWKTCKIKKQQITLGITMLMTSITGMEILADFKKPFQIAGYYEQYLLLLLLLIFIFGMAIIKMNNKD